MVNNMADGQGSRLKTISEKIPVFVLSSEERAHLLRGWSGAVLRPFMLEFADYMGVLRSGLWSDIRLEESMEESSSGLLRAQAQGVSTPPQLCYLRPAIPGALPGRQVCLNVFAEITRIDWESQSCFFCTDAGLAGMAEVNLVELVRMNYAELLKRTDGAILQQIIAGAAIAPEATELLVRAVAHLVVIGRARIGIDAASASVKAVSLGTLGRVVLTNSGLSREALYQYWDQSQWGRETPSIANPWVWSWELNDIKWRHDAGVILFGE